MAEMLTDLLQNIYNRIASLGKSIQELKESLDSLNQNIEQKISNLTEKIAEFSKEIDWTQTKHIEALKEIGENVTFELKRVHEGLGMNAFENMVSNLENFSKLAEDVLNQDNVNLILSEAINSVKLMKQSLRTEEEQ